MSLSLLRIVDIIMDMVRGLKPMAVALALMASAVGCNKSCPPGTRADGSLCKRIAEDGGLSNDAGPDSDAEAKGTRKQGVTGVDAGSMRADDNHAGSGGGHATGADAAVGGTGGGDDHQPASVGGSSSGGNASNAGVGGMGGAGTLAAVGGMGGAGSVAAVGGMSGAQTGPACGDGHRDPGETCDGDCVSECPAQSACVHATLTGSADHCDVACSSTPITTCIKGDGCCPAGCTHTTDDDCSVKCGDGTVDPGEKCEPKSTTQPCPTSCDDQDVCTMDMLVGSADQCSAECVHAPLMRKAVDCDDGDPCTADSQVESQSSCTYECMHAKLTRKPVSCDDGDACTTDSQVPSTDSCTYTCAHAAGKPGLSSCSGRCVDRLTDSSNCGTCGTICTGGKTCSQGVCSCPSDQHDCGSGQCVSKTALDACGASCAVCTAGKLEKATCDGSTCGVMCTTNVTCFGACVDTNTDPKNCGGCGISCENLQPCINGGCM